jgi:hypothetical protein
VHGPDLMAHPSYVHTYIHDCFITKERNQYNKKWKTLTYICKTGRYVLSLNDRTSIFIVCCVSITNNDTNIQPFTQQSFYLSTLYVSTTMGHLQVFSFVFTYTLFTIELQHYIHTFDAMLYPPNHQVKIAFLVYYNLILN